MGPPWQSGLCCRVSAIQEFYCNKGKKETITEVNEGIIKTLEPGSEFYSNDLTCGWELDASENGRIQLTIESVDLQWNPEYSTCSGYDNLEIREGTEKNNTQLTSICHAKNPYSVISRGRYLYLKFSSNHQNFDNRRGIQIRFKTFKDQYCPPDWFQVSPSSEDCLMIGFSGKADWSRAQDVCNFNRANLASILTEFELNTILDHGRNSSSTLTTAWIGLSDREIEGLFKWIDRHKLSYERKKTGIRYDTHCVAQDFTTGDWSVLKCDSLQNYICKCKKDGSTVLYQADPATPPPDEDDDGTKIFLIVILVVVFIVVSCVAIVLFYCCYWRKREPHGNSRKKKENVENENLSGARQFTPLERQGSAPSAPPQEDVMLHDPQMVAPPTYEESRYDPIAVSPSTY
ncbi:uncharacterized protein LOC123549038 [Mercenaria mercenaria]|uniref:uncharacterized protein LOC123549038 n=1 Tax=Mercenaria mercenaria TaxID=6596 RepID=UPI00234EC092|nr:uncharacterized protein LOC123549038 [Mercenaria mercenaria]